MFETARLALGIKPSGEDAHHAPLPPLRSGALAVGYTTAMDLLDMACRVLLLVLLTGELCLILVEVTQRQLVDHSFLWGEEVSRLVLLTVAFLGGALSYRAQSHTAVSFVLRALSPGMRRATEAMLDLMVLALAIICGLASLDLLEINSYSIMPMTEWNLSLIVIPFTTGMVCIGLFAIERLARHHSGPAMLRGLAALVAFSAVVMWIGTPDVRPSQAVSMVVMLLLFFGAILIGLPVAYAMLFGSVLFLTLTDLAPLVAVAQNTIDGSGHFILLTLPFFIWAGMIMEKGGISVRLVNFAMTMVGHFRGGLLQVVVITTYLVSGVSGSKIADVVAVGSVMREELERKGYKMKDGAAVLAASAAMSETIPPSIAMLVLGSVVPISIGSMFVAGLLPAAVLAFLLMTLIYINAVRHPVASVARATGAERLSAAAGAILPLLMPAILIIGIKFGVATPTEVSTVAVLYGILISAFVYRSIGFAGFVRITIACAVMSGMVLFIIAAAGSFAWIMAAGNLPQYLVATLHAAGDSKYLFLIGSILILIVVGSLLEGLPALIILAPILYPIATQLGIDGVHYAMVLLLAMGVGIFMPPIGIGFHISCSVMKSTVEDTSRAILPYLAMLLVGILVVAFVPWFSHVVLDMVGR